VRILGFDTATPATTVAFLDTDRHTAIERRDDPARRERPRHTTRLMELIVEALTAAGAGWGDVDRMAVGIGPGTFTGLRIGVATARALSRARDIPLVGVSTLHSLARGAASAAAADHGIMAVIDARRGEVFAAGWRVADVARAGGEPVLAPRALGPDALAAEIADLGGTWMAAGDGAVAFRAALEGSGAWIPEEDSELNRVSAIEHCRLASGLRPEPPDGVRPEYLRLPDAEITLRASRQR
jgi:tRNA threonylcarbamoyladenosine biosynthesis protein TsaB